MTFKNKSVPLFCVRKDELLAEINDWQEFLRVDSEMSLLLEEKNRTGLPIDSDDFCYVVEKITACDTWPGKAEKQLAPHFFT